MSTTEAAHALGITIPTVIAWIGRGHLEGSKERRGGRWVWRCTESSVRQRQLATGRGGERALEERIRSLEEVITEPRPEVSRALRDWIAAEETASRRLRDLAEMLGQIIPGMHERGQRAEAPRNRGR